MNPGLAQLQLVEPSMAIHRDGPAQEYARLIAERDRLLAQSNGGFRPPLDDEQTVRVLLVNQMEAGFDLRCQRIAGAEITSRANSPKLTQRFLCAVWPPYLGVKAQDRWIRERAYVQAIEWFAENLTEARAAGKIAEKDYSGAAVLDGTLRVMKPLKLTLK